MSSSRRIPEATVARLPVYLRALSEVAGEQLRTISSDLLAERAGVNAAQVRKDLSHLGSYGTRGVGYDVDYLIREINRQLGLAEQHRVAIIGVGNLGRALVTYQGFPARGFRVVAALDADPDKVGQQLGDCVVAPISALPEVVAAQRVDVAVVTTPASATQGVVDSLVAAGVTSLLNFAPTGVHVPAGVSIRQVDLAVELQILSFYEHQQRAAVAEVG